MHLNELIVHRCVCDGRKMENRIKPRHFRIAELVSPIERRQVFCDKITTITSEILEIARPEIVNYRKTRIWESFLQRQRQIGADEARAAGDNEVR